VKDQNGGDQIGSDGKNRDGEEELIQTHPGSLESGDFTVGGESSKGEKRAHENTHGNGEDKEGGRDEHQEFQDLNRIDPPGDNQLNELEDLVHQEDNGECHQTDEKDGQDFLEDIKVGCFLHLVMGCDPPPRTDVLILREGRGYVNKGLEKLDFFS
jgi:hypothetical protein